MTKPIIIHPTTDWSELLGPVDRDGIDPDALLVGEIGEVNCGFRFVPIDPPNNQTVREIVLKLAESDKAMAGILRHTKAALEDLHVYGTHISVGRQVCARRARKLRRRGEDVLLIGRTKNGKALYSWLRRIPPMEFMKP